MPVSDKKPQVLITGGAGYIGSVLVGRLLNRGYHVRVIDNLSFGGTSLLSVLYHPRFELIAGDTTKADDLNQALKDIDIVIHLAAIVGDPACQKYPEEAARINGDASRKLCEMVRERKIFRFIFASTCSNYGKMPDNEKYVDERSPLNPISHYARLKVEFEDYLLSQKDDSFCPTCLRFATAYGLSPRPRFDLTVNEFTAEITLGNNLEIYGEQFWRPYCHTVDIARACRIVMESDPNKVAGQAFNVGSTNENYRKKDLAGMIIDELPQGRKLISYVPRDEDPRDYRVNFDKIRSVLDFKNSFTVKNGIREIKEAILKGLIPDPKNKLYRNL